MHTKHMLHEDALAFTDTLSCLVVVWATLVDDPKEIQSENIMIDLNFLPVTWPLVL